MDTKRVLIFLNNGNNESIISEINDYMFQLIKISAEAYVNMVRHLEFCTKDPNVCLFFHTI